MNWSDWWLKRCRLKWHHVPDAAVDEWHWNCAACLPYVLCLRQLFEQSLWICNTCQQLTAVIYVISPHGIAMPKGLYFTAVVSFFLFRFFSTPDLRGHWTDLKQTWTHIHLWLLFEIFGPNSLWHLPPPPRGGSKTPLFGDRLWISTEHMSATDTISTIGKKLVNLQGLPTCPQIW